MSVSIVVPELGESVLEATIAHWLKQEGDRVALGEPLVELETDKVNLEVPARQAGILKHIERKEQEDVKVGDVIGIMEEVEEPGLNEAVSNEVEAPALSGSVPSVVEVPAPFDYVANTAAPLREEETSITKNTPHPSSFIPSPYSTPHPSTTPVAQRLVRDLRRRRG